MRSALGGRPGVSDIRLRAFEKGSVVAYIDIIVDEEGKREEVRETLVKRVQEDQAIGALRVDRESFSVGEVSTTTSTATERSTSTTEDEDYAIESMPTTTTTTTTERVLFEPTRVDEVDADDAESRQASTKTYVIVGVVCLIVLVVIAVALVKLIGDHRRRQRRRKAKFVSVLTLVMCNPLLCVYFLNVLTF